MEQLSERGVGQPLQDAVATRVQAPAVEQPARFPTPAVAGPAPAVRGYWPPRPLVAGALASVALLAFYLGVITLAQGWGHALDQLREDRWFAGAIALGFGTQMGLFTYLRALHARAATGGVAVSGGTSTAAMLACCAHHLADILPIVGLSGAAIFLNAYKTPLLWLGIAMNLVGILYLLRKISEQRQRSCDAIRRSWQS